MLESSHAVIIHDWLLSEFGGLPGVRDAGRLESLFDHAAGQRYPEIWDKAAHVLFGICRYHPFADGNKRTAVACAAEILIAADACGADVDTKLEDVAYSVAAGTAGESDAAKHIERMVISAKA